MKLKPKNVYAAIPDSSDKEIFEELLKTNNVIVERIISSGHRSPESGWYDQERNEWVLVLKGRATLAFEDQKTIDLNEGDYINIPSHTKHKVIWTEPDRETIWLAIHY
jgi:cupin 2 domain-containing protein